MRILFVFEKIEIGVDKENVWCYLKYIEISTPNK